MGKKNHEEEPFQGGVFHYVMPKLCPNTREALSLAVEFILSN